MYMSVLCAYMYAYKSADCACLMCFKEGVRSLGTGATDGCRLLPVMGDGNPSGTLGEPPVLLATFYLATLVFHLIKVL